MYSQYILSLRMSEPAVAGNVSYAEANKQSFSFQI